MLKRVNWSLAAWVIGVGMGAPGVFADAPSTQPALTNQQLLDRINSLEAEVNQLKSEQKPQTQVQAPTQQKTEEANPFAQVQADADQNSQLLDATPNFVGGWNPQKMQLFIGTDDGNFYFHPGIITQFRYVANYVNQPHQNTDGFEVRRMKFYFDGNAFTKDLTYKFQWQDADQGGSPTLEWGWAQYVFAHNVGRGDLGVKAGQFKEIEFKEQAIASDTTQPLVERSAADTLVGGNALGGPLVQGVDLVYTGNKSCIHNDLVFMDGTNSGNTDFTNVPTATTKVHWGASDRVDWKVFGDWADNTDISGQSANGHDLLDIGGGIGYTDGTVVETGGQVGRDVLRFDVDAQYLMARRFSIFTAFYDNCFRNIGAASSRNDIAGLIEGGAFVAPAWQIVARYDITELGDRFKIATKADFTEIGAGLNYYLGPDGAWANHAKFSLDVDYLPNGFPSTGATGLGYVASTSDNEIVFRGMFQLWL